LEQDARIQHIQADVGHASIATTSTYDRTAAPAQRPPRDLVEAASGQATLRLRTDQPSSAPGPDQSYFTACVGTFRRRCHRLHRLALAGFGTPAMATTVAAADIDRLDEVQLSGRGGRGGARSRTVVYRSSRRGPHGIIRDLITREVYVDDKSKDQIYDISNVKVTSPSGTARSSPIP